MEVCQCACLQIDPWSELFWGKFQTKNFRIHCTEPNAPDITCLVQKTGYQGYFYGGNVSGDIYKNTENFWGFSIEMPFLNEKYKIVQNSVSWKSSFKYKTMRKQDAFHY